MNKETVKVALDESGTTAAFTTMTLPVFEMEHAEYTRTLQTKWFSDEFYELLSKHRYSILLKNITTGERTAIQTFGARFPLIASPVA